MWLEIRRCKTSKQYQNRTAKHVKYLSKYGLAGLGYKLFHETVFESMELYISLQYWRVITVLWVAVANNQTCFFLSVNAVTFRIRIVYLGSNLIARIMYYFLRSIPLSTITNHCSAIQVRQSLFSLRRNNILLTVARN